VGSGEVIAKSAVLAGVEDRLLEPRKLLAGVGAFVGLLLLSELTWRVTLPYDEKFGLVIYLMWSGSSSHITRLQPLLGQISKDICYAGIIVLLAAIAVPARILPTWASRVVRMAYRYAAVIPLFYLLTAQLSRYVFNLVYVLGQYVRWDFTPWIARIEAPLIEHMQHVLASPRNSVLFSTVYSFVWSIAVLGSGPAIIVADRPRLINRVILGYFLISFLAVPFFVLLPVYDPWTTNPIYGNAGGFATHIQYSYPRANLFMLRFIANDYNKWASAYCLPSLHVSFPLLFYFLTRRGGLRVLSWVYLAITAATCFAIVYLGRHWIVDIIVAIPYTYGIARLTEKINVDFTLT
jgi:membrane-associated phospholipid phosphatase